MDDVVCQTYQRNGSESSFMGRERKNSQRASLEMVGVCGAHPLEPLVVKEK